MKCLKEDGTISSYEWEAFGIYQAIIYRKTETKSGQTKSKRFTVPRPSKYTAADILKL